MDKISLSPKNVDPQKLKSYGVTGGVSGVAAVVAWWLLNQYGAIEARVDVGEKKDVAYEADRVAVKDKLSEVCDDQKTLVNAVNDIKGSIKTIELRIANIEKKSRRR